MLERDQLRARGFLVFELLDLVADLGLLIPARLDTRFNVPDLFQDRPVVLEILCEEVLLFTNLGENDTDLVRDVRNGVIVCGLAPVGQLRSN